MICAHLVTTGRKGAENHTLRQTRTRSETAQQYKGAPLVDYESLADMVRRGLGLDERSSPFSFAHRMHLEIAPAHACANGAELLERTIHWDALQHEADQLRAFAREVCRWVLRASARDDSDRCSCELRSSMFPCVGASHGAPSNVHCLRVLRQPVRAPRKGVASPSARQRRPPARGVQRP